MDKVHALRIIPVILLATCLFFLSSCSNNVDYKYQYEEVSSAISDNEDVFIQAVNDMNDVYNDGIDKATLENLDSLYKTKSDDAKIVYFADTAETPIDYAQSLDHKDQLDEYVEQYGEDVIEVFKEYKKIDGVYACYFLDTEEHFIPVESEALEEVFEKTPVGTIWYEPEIIEFTCGEGNVKENYFIGSEYIYTSDGQEPPLPDYVSPNPVEKDKGLMYENDSTFYYIERLTDNFFFVSESGRDA